MLIYETNENDGITIEDFISVFINKNRKANSYVDKLMSHMHVILQHTNVDIPDNERININAESELKINEFVKIINRIENFEICLKQYVKIRESYCNKLNTYIISHQESIMKLHTKIIEEYDIKLDDFITFINNNTPEGIMLEQLMGAIPIIDNIYATIQLIKKSGCNEKINNILLNY